jgi:hypothetical protein
MDLSARCKSFSTSLNTRFVAHGGDIGAGVSTALGLQIIDKYRSWSDCEGDPERCFTRDELLTLLSLYWFTRSMPSAIRLYYSMRKSPLKFAAGQRVEIPVAIARFPKELPTPPRSYSLPAVRT